MVSVAKAKIPHSLGLVIDFVNTLDLDERTDALDSPERLRRWLVERDLLARCEASPGGRGRESALRLREALRALMLANNGGEPDPAAVSELDRAARRGQLGVELGPRGAVELVSRGEGVDGALAALVMAVAEASQDGTWQRVKACRADDCRWAFYDRSRNRSGAWCSMAVCGNRAKVRAYRNRAEHRAAG